MQATPTEKVRANRRQILELAERFGARDLRIFGSVARGADRAESDLDLLAAFEPGRSLLDQIGLEQALEDLLGCEVEVIAEGGISRHLETAILTGVRPL